MKCQHCAHEIPAAAQTCPRCGSQFHQAALTGMSGAPSGRAVSGLTELATSETGVAADAPASPSAGGSLAGAAVAPAPLDSQIRRAGWTPKREAVEAWAIKKELSHYEVLEADEQTSDEILAERIKVLERRLDKWAGDPMDATLQKLGSVGMNRLYELRAELRDRATYNEFIRRERHTAAVRRVREAAHQCVVNDGVLQWSEWKFNLLPKAEEEGVSRAELEEILAELRAGGALTGLSLAAGEVRTILELRDACQGQADALVEALWDGRLAHWLEEAALRRDLAEEARRIGAEYADNKLSGAHRLLWRMGEKHLMLVGADGHEEGINNLRSWIEGVYCRGLEAASLRAHENRRLENWLGVALNQERLSNHAAHERGHGRAGLWQVIWASGERSAEKGSAYQMTRSLVQEYPQLWEAHFQHAVHCAGLRRLDEMRTYLRQAIKGDVGYATRAMNDPDLQAVREEILPLVRESVPVSSFKFKKGEAFSIADLIALCDQYPEEAQDYLYSDYLEDWLGKKQGEGALASQARTITKAKSKSKPEGLEFFVRALCQAVGLEPFPQLSMQPEQIDFGALPVGAQGRGTLQLKNNRRGRAWGTISVEPKLPGLKCASTFNHQTDTLELKLDTLRVAPGSYQGKLVISVEGVPTPLEVPVRFIVRPLEVRVEPSAVELGTIMHGTKCSVAVKVTCAPAGGRVVSTSQKLEPAVKGVSVTGELKGAADELRITVDTAQLQTGTNYKTSYIVETNIGTLRIPIRFKTSLFWKWIVLWRTLGYSLGTGAVMFLCRYLLRSAGGLDGWFYSYENDVGTIIATGAFGAVVTGALVLAFRNSRLVRKLLRHKLLSRAAAKKLLDAVGRDTGVTTIMSEDSSEARRPEKRP
ncbi:MAG: hypothetical protein ACJ74W_22065 [Pyrinomonadaceae bacterium]